MSLIEHLDRLETRVRIMQKLHDQDAPSLECLDARCKVEDVKDEIVALFMELERKSK